MERRRSVLLLPGQGAQRERMAAGLYGAREEFTAPMDEFFGRLGTTGERLRSAWLRPAPNPELDESAVAQPLLLAVGHALGRAVGTAAEPPALLLGHSVGELAAACLVGVFDPADIGALAAARSRALEGTDTGTGTGAGHGGMLAVAMPVEELTGELGGYGELGSPGELGGYGELEGSAGGVVVAAELGGSGEGLAVAAAEPGGFGDGLAVTAAEPGASGDGLAVTAAEPGGFGGGVAVAAVNGPRQTVLAGPREALAAVEQRLRDRGILVRTLRSGHAFHSPAMEGAALRFGEALAGFGPRAPRAAAAGTVVSTRTGVALTAAQARDPHFWGGQLAAPVRYWPALRELLDTLGRRPGLLLLDGSADRSLSAPARHHPAVRDGASEVVPLLAVGRDAGGPADARVFAEALHRLGEQRDHTAVS
ncbi:acyltransferase domain-containing protein [Streptomyces liliifuscus]|uniref:Acyltransferase domain-containing protein n=1 Tax=Streptomyces liliifuscus TaxID=2797636 RepID=A0A7T7REI3_9ACTN|nr:acyltransferase domain-containing protein [Streptomyces liliifuscus]QQM43696.1 acyltransferase domain-containing protein [Streptomyces liliifuscus]